MVLLAPIIWFVNENYRHEMSRRLRKVQESWSRVASTLAESVSGIRVTQAFVRHDVNAGFFQKLIDVHGENNVGVAQASAVFVPLLGVAIVPLRDPVVVAAVPPAKYAGAAPNAAWNNGP